MDNSMFPPVKNGSRNCWACMFADECLRWLDISPYTQLCCVQEETQESQSESA